MAENIYYDQIMALNGMDSFKELIQRWQIFSDNLTKFNAKQGLVIPDLVWISDNGIDKENLLIQLTGYLDESKNLMDFYGNIKCFDHYVEYVADKEKIHEIEKLAEKIRDAAGFRSEYKGVLALDLSEWVGHFNEENFINFLKFLKTMDSDIAYIFCVPNYSQQDVQQLLELLVLFFRIEVLEMKLPDSAELATYVKSEIAGYGLNLDAEAQNMVVETVNRLRSDQYFAGYEMLDRLAEDIVYSVYTSTPPYDGVVTMGMISAFAPDGMYVSQLIQNNARVYKSQFEN